MADISIIVPVFNAENEISTCLDSLLHQIGVTLEILIVNDCSTDSTHSIIEVYKNSYRNIKIINLDRNSGPGIARNEGIKHITGDYIGFIDSDDWVDLNFYSKLLHSAKYEESDIVISGIVDEYNNSISSELRYSYDDFISITGRVGLKLLTKSCNLGMFISPIMNNKIYKTDFIKKHNIHCCENKSWQDDFFSFFAILHAEKICIVPNIQYHYSQRCLSITHSATNSITKIDNCIDVLIKIRTELHMRNLYNEYKKDYDAFVERCISSLLSMLRREHYSNLNDSLIYLFDKIYQNFNMKEIIEYLDNERIYKFFNL